MIKYMLLGYRPCDFEAIIKNVLL